MMTISNLQLRKVFKPSDWLLLRSKIWLVFDNSHSDGGYWIFMTSKMGHSWSLMGVGSYVEIWPNKLRVQAHWQLAKFGDETAVCNAGARPHPLIGWKPSSLSTPGGSKEKIIVSKSEILEKLPLDENIVTCSVLEYNWTMDTLYEPMKKSEIYLNRPKWPRVTSRKSFENASTSGYFSSFPEDFRFWKVHKAYHHQLETFIRHRWESGGFSNWFHQLKILLAETLSQSNWKLLSAILLNHFKLKMFQVPSEISL